MCSFEEFVNKNFLYAFAITSWILKILLRLQDARNKDTKPPKSFIKS